MIFIIINGFFSCFLINVTPRQTMTTNNQKTKLYPYLIRHEENGGMIIFYELN